MAIEVPVAFPKDREGRTSDILERNEGRSNTRYFDSEGIPTIGVGFNLNRSDARDKINALGYNYDQVVAGTQDITTNDADTLRDEDLATARTDVESLIPGFENFTTQDQQIALFDMAFNLGRTKMAGFTRFLAAMNNKDSLNFADPNFKTAADELLKSRYANQVGSRAFRNAAALSSGAGAFSENAKQRFLKASTSSVDDNLVMQKMASVEAVPTDLIRAKKEEFKKKHEAQNFNQAIEIAPATRSFLEDDDNLGVTHDDVPALVSFETAFNSLRALAQSPLDYVGSVLSGAGDLNAIAGRLIARPIAAGLNAIGLEDVVTYLQENTELPYYLDPTQILGEAGVSLKQAGEVIGPVPEDENFITQVAGGVGQMATQITVAILTGGLSGPVSTGSLFALGADIAGDAVKETGKAGTLNGDLAQLAGGTATAALERVGLGFILNKIPKAFASRIARSMAGATTEAAQEMAESIAHNMIKLGLLDPNTKLFAGTVREGEVAGTVGAIVSALIPGKQRSRAAKVLDQADKESKKIQINESDPVRAAEHRALVVEGMGDFEVVVPMEDVLKFAEQSDNSPAALKSLGIEGQVFADAAGNVTIAGVQFAQNIMGTDAYGKLSENMQVKVDQRILEDVEAIAAEEIEAVAQEGRVAAVEQELTDVEIEIDTIQTNIEQRELNNLKAPKSRQQPVKALNKRLEKALEKQKELQEDAANLEKRAQEAALKAKEPLAGRKGQQPAEQVVKPKAKGKVVTSVEKLERLKVKTSKATVVAVRKAFRDGVRKAQKSQKEIQRALQRVVKEQGLSRDQFEVLIANTTPENFTKQLAKIQARATAILEKKARKDIRTALKTLLKKKALKQPKRRGEEGRFNARVQRILNGVRTTASRFASKPKAQAEIVKRLGQFETNGRNVDPQELLEMNILDILADSQDATLREFEQTLLDLDAIVEEGSRAAAARRFKVRLQQETNIEAATTTLKLAAGVTEITGDEVTKGLKAVLQKTGGGFSYLQDTFEVLMDKSFGNTKLGQDLRDRLTKLVDEAVEAQKVFANQQGRDFRALGLEVYGLQGNKFENYLNSLERTPSETIRLPNTAGKMVEFSFSPSQMMDIWMKIKDPTLASEIRSEDGNAISPEMEAHINEILSTQDKQFAEGLMAQYQDTYNKVNVVYSRVFGADLPRNEFYSPLRRKQRSQIADVDAFLADTNERATATKGFLEARKKPEEKIDFRSAPRIAMLYYHQAGHFITHMDASVELQGTLRDARTRDAIRLVRGQTFYDQIDNFLTEFTVGNAKNAEVIHRWANEMTRNFSLAVLGFKPNLALKQLLSIPAYATFIPSKHFAAGMVSFARNPIKAVKILSATDFMQERGSNQDVKILELNRAGVLKDGTSWLIKKRFDEYALKFTRLGDRAAIYAGGWPIYRYHKDVLGETHEQAIAAFAKATSRSQQSADINRLSAAQRSNSAWMRATSRFMSAPASYARLEGEALRKQFRRIDDGSKREISFSTFAKQVIILHIMLPALWQTASDAFFINDDEEGNLPRSIILGPLNGVLILGDFLALLYASAIQGSVWEREDLSFFNSWSLIIKSVQGDGGIDSINGEDVGEAIGLVLGLPTEATVNIYEGLFEEEDPLKQGLRAFGWSEARVKD